MILCIILIISFIILLFPTKLFEKFTDNKEMTDKINNRLSNRFTLNTKIIPSNVCKIIEEIVNNKSRKANIDRNVLRN
jgi:predicted nucleic acid-binding protein